LPVKEAADGVHGSFLSLDPNLEEGDPCDEDFGSQEERDAPILHA